MRSYFRGMTSPQITSGDSGLRVLTCFGVFFLLLRGIKLSVFCFPGAASGFKFVEEMVKVQTPKSVQGSLSLPPPLALWHRTAPLSERH